MSAVKFGLSIVLISTTVGCAVPVENRFNPMAVNDTPDTEKAYLIINANVIPADEPQPSWLAVEQLTKVQYLSTRQDIFQLRPTRTRVADFYFHPDDFDYMKKRRVVDLQAEVIHFYGRLELDRTNRLVTISTIGDLTVYYRACQQAPELFRKYPVVPIGPISESDFVIPGCEDVCKLIDCDGIIEEIEIPGFIKPEDLNPEEVEEIEVVDESEQDEDEVVCRKEKVTGSHRKETVCRARSGIESRRDEDQQMIRDVQSAPGNNRPQ